MRFRMLQIADLHVGKLRSTWGHKTSLLRAEQMFSAVMKAAKQNKVHAICIPGDIFDFKDVTHKERELVSRKLAELAEFFDVYAIPGNHDMLSEAPATPAASTDFLAEITENTDEIKRLHVAFASKPSVWQVRPGLHIAGIPASHCEDQEFMDSYCPSLTTGKYIVMGHAPVRGCKMNDKGFVAPADKQERYLTLSTIGKNRNILWWAFGDIHTRQQLPTLPPYARGAYAGTPIQTKFDEVKGRGGIIVAFDYDGTTWSYRGQRFVELDTDLAPLVTITSEEQLDSLPDDVFISLGKGVILPESRHKQVCKTFKVIEDKSTPQEVLQMTNGTAQVEEYNPLTATEAEIESSVLGGLPDDRLVRREAQKIVQRAVVRFQGRSFVA